VLVIKSFVSREVFMSNDKYKAISSLPSIHLA
jgi:hypothetical protein